MNNPNLSNEIWQVEVNGQVYEANLEELTQWIAEGALLPQDKVKRGNLRWLEAGKIPLLYGFFNAKELGQLPQTPVLTLTDATQPEVEFPNQEQTTAAEPTFVQNSVEQNFVSVNEIIAVPLKNKTEPKFESFADLNETNVCARHSSELAKLVCQDCRKFFCKICPSSFGSSVKVCPDCGGLCKAIEVVKENHQRNFQLQTDLNTGFGFGDFGRALAFPFKYRFSLFSGALLFMFFNLGQNAAGVGGMMMISASIISAMMANALVFGCLANTVDNMSQGHLQQNFMPDFDDFSVWDDVVHPFFLSIGAYLVSFGLLIVLVFGMVWYSLNSISKLENENPQQIVEQVKSATKNDRLNSNGEYILEQQQEKFSEDEEFEELQNTIKQQRQSQLESVVGKNPETVKKENSEAFRNFLKIGIPFVLLGFAALLWGVFYFPIACAVAGYTRSFTSTINPLVGLDTIRRMGFDYVKILGMCLLLAIISGVISGILSAVLSPFDLPGMGNLPAKAIGSLFTFYFSIVFACILGFALYKNSSRLNLYR